MVFSKSCTGDVPWLGGVHDCQVKQSFRAPLALCLEFCPSLGAAMWPSGRKASGFTLCSLLSPGNGVCHSGPHLRFWTSPSPGHHRCDYRVPKPQVQQFSPCLRFCPSPGHCQHDFQIPEPQIFCHCGLCFLWVKSSAALGPSSDSVPHLDPFNPFLRLKRLRFWLVGAVI